MLIAALLCAIGIIIPMFSPLKIVLEPASFTLGSHVAIFIAMFISPAVAVFVALGPTAGVFFGGFPIVIVMRAAPHVVFALIGALILQKRRDILDSAASAMFFSFVIAVIHAACEVAVVTPFYFGQTMSQGYYAKGFVTSVILLVGIGSVVHSMVDFIISLYIWKPLQKVINNSNAQ
jgi:niacin transporter